MAGPGYSRYAADLSQSDEFRIWHCKILPCRKRYSHDWNECVFAHPGEKIQRRCPRKHQYLGIMCPEIKKFSVCPRGESCCYAHNSFEYWLHPSRYRTEMCTFGTACSRSVCFFAHTTSELRTPLGLTQPSTCQSPFDGPGPSTGGPPQALTPTAALYSTASASPRADPATWSPTMAAASTPLDLATAMTGLSLARRSPLSGTPTTPFSTTHYTADAAALPPAAGVTTNYTPFVPQSTPYPIQPRNAPDIPPAALLPASTMAPTLRPALRATLPTVPLALTLPPAPDTNSYPTLRATAPSSFSTVPSPSAVIIASTAEACRSPNQPLSLSPYQDTYLAADPAPPGAMGPDLGFDPPTGAAGLQGVPPEAYYGEYPAVTTAMQQMSVSGLLAPAPYTDALGSIALAAQVASSSGLMYPYVQ